MTASVAAKVAQAKGAFTAAGIGGGTEQAAAAAAVSEDCGLTRSAEAAGAIGAGIEEARGAAETVVTKWIVGYRRAALSEHL